MRIFARQSFLRFRLLAWCLASLVACDALAQSRSIDERLTALHKVERDSTPTEKQRFAAIEKIYIELFAAEQTPSKLRVDSDSDVRHLFDAAHVMAFYTCRPVYVGHLAAAFAELERRHLASRANHLDFYRILIAARRLDEAREFARTHPGTQFEILPKVREVVPTAWRGPTELAIDENGDALEHRTVDLQVPAMVVVVSHPLCHFSQNAIRDLAADAQLNAALKTHTKWLAPPDGEIRLALFKQWNREHPDFRMAIAYSTFEWPKVDSWETPSFYFFKNGRLLTTVTGWPREGHREEVRAGLRTIGLLQ